MFRELKVETRLFHLLTSLLAGLPARRALCTSVQSGGRGASPFDGTKRALHFRTSRRDETHLPNNLQGPAPQPTRARSPGLTLSCCLLATAAMMSWAADSRSSRDAGGFPQRHLCIRSTLVFVPGIVLNGRLAMFPDGTRKTLLPLWQLPASFKELLISVKGWPRCLIHSSTTPGPGRGSAICPAQVPSSASPS